MFVGFQKNMPVCFAETQEGLEQNKFIKLDEIKQFDFAELYAGKIYTDAEELAQVKLNDQKAAEIADLKAKLAATDYAVVKIAEGSATPEEYAELIEQRKAWRARINELEA